MFTKDGEDDSRKRPTDPEDAKASHKPVSERWVSACDTCAQLYVDCQYDPAENWPATGSRLDFPSEMQSQSNEPYNVGYEPTTAPIWRREIAEALVKRFHGEAMTTKSTRALRNSNARFGRASTARPRSGISAVSSTGSSSTTNIDEVKQIIYGGVRNIPRVRRVSYDVKNAAI